MKYFIGEHTNQYVNIAITNQGFLKKNIFHQTKQAAGYAWNKYSYHTSSRADNLAL